MSIRVNPGFIKELTKYGAREWNACFHCGNCTAVCSLTERGILFPRKEIRAIQMGLTEKLASSPEPWLCYYCGDCSENCPRDANPGEIMMSLRRYLTSIYDWTGMAARLYKSYAAHLWFMIFLFLAVIAAFVVFSRIPDSPEVKLNTFAPVHIISLLDHILLIFLGSFLITNIINMYVKIIIKDKTVKIPVWLYFKEAWNAIFQFATQWNITKCQRNNWYWFGHWFLFTGYILMFVMVIFFLDWFQTEEIHPFYHPQRILGYYVTAGFLFATIYFMIGRYRKKKEIFKYSHHSDWIFVVLLFLLAFTGIFIHIFRVNGMALPTYYAYVLHLAVEVPMVVTFVAFSKWSHLAYRPLAIYFAHLKKSARALQEKNKIEFVTQ